jgi:hypothetical protein
LSPVAVSLNASAGRAPVATNCELRPTLMSSITKLCAMLPPTSRRVPRNSTCGRAVISTVVFAGTAARVNPML